MAHKLLSENWIINGQRFKIAHSNIMRWYAIDNNHPAPNLYDGFTSKTELIINLEAITAANQAIDKLKQGA